MPNGELDQLQTQRNALSGLLARFTADRDLLITTVQACEQRLQELGARFEALKAATAATAAEPPAIGELRQALVELQRTHEQAVADARTAAKEAQARAEEAHQRAAQAVERCDQLAQAAASGAAAPAVEPAAIEELRQAIAQLKHSHEQAVAADRTAAGEAQARAEQAVSRAEAALQRGEQLAQASSAGGTKAKQVQTLNRTVERLTKDREQVDAEIARLKIAVAQPQEAVSQIVARIATVEAELIELRRNLERGREAERGRDPSRETRNAAPPEPRLTVVPPTSAARPPATARATATWLWAAVVAGVVLATAAAMLMSRQPSPQPISVARAPTAAPVVAAPDVEPPAPTVASNSLSVEPQMKEPDVAAPPAAPAAAAEAPRPARPAALVSLSPEGTTACVLDREHKQVCVYRRAGDQIVADGCYPITLPALDAWPRWLVPSGLNDERIRLVDETNHRRLKIVPDASASGPDVAHMSPPDYQALSRQTKPWLTAWVVADDSTAGDVNPDTTELATALDEWRSAWEQQHLDDYLNHYSAAFVPQVDEDVATWRAHKRALFEHGAKLSIQLPTLTVVAISGGQAAMASFEQVYRAGASTTHSFKVLQWVREDGHWKIRAENVLEEAKK